MIRSRQEKDSRYGATQLHPWICFFTREVFNFESIQELLNKKCFCFMFFFFPYRHPGEVRFTSGVAATIYQHLKNLPSCEAYTEFYVLVVQIFLNGVSSFATLIQRLLVDLLGTRDALSGKPLGDRFEIWWTGPRVCAIHNTSAPTTTLPWMWTGAIKKLSQASASLTAFIVAFIHFLTHLNKQCLLQCK